MWKIEDWRSLFCVGDNVKLEWNEEEGRINRFFFFVDNWLNGLINGLDRLGLVWYN